MSYAKHGLGHATSYAISQYSREKMASVHGTYPEQYLKDENKIIWTLNLLCAKMFIRRLNDDY